ncbi:ribosome silencing factor [Lapidilactobacillus achengensis]|uniref:Ribosomal silencing factor RsfS n=1 Tax=Lapidilactobacillus achengensis TaxID=2486000 RepID=A0ABW1UQ93_9LACO|nr:ribosome silencing factor [Lapidilactobacillus achengensis]
MISSEEILKTAVIAADDKRAEDIVALDMRKVSLLADYFVIMHAGSTRQVEAITDEIVNKVTKSAPVDCHVEGNKDSQWVLIDFKDVVIHIFTEETREFYNLEKLWADAPLVDLGEWVKA